MIQTEERVALGDMVRLLCFYEGLFVEPCTRCDRILAGQGHCPPLIRLWRDGVLERRHVTCMAD